MCDVARQRCMCCGPPKPLTSTADGVEEPSNPSVTAAPPECPQDENMIIVAAEIEPKARQANLFKLDSLVLGMPLAKVEISQDEVAALEAEARRALEEGYYCDWHCYGQDTKDLTGRKMSDGAKVLVVLTPEIVSCWSPPLSYARLEFSEHDKQVRRPPFSSAFPAALVRADAEKPTSVCFRVTAFPASRTVFTVGVAKYPGFKVYFGKGFGEEEHSWGLQWRGEDGSPVHPDVSSLRLSCGDLICITCDTWAGSSTITLNGREAGMFNIPCGQAFVLGATLATGCILRIESQ